MIRNEARKLIFRRARWGFFSRNAACCTGLPRDEPTAKV